MYGNVARESISSGHLCHMHPGNNYSVSCPPAHMGSRDFISQTLPKMGVHDVLIELGNTLG